MKLNLTQTRKLFPVAGKILDSKKIRKATLNIGGTLYIDEDTTYTLVAPDGSTKTIRVGGEWGGHANTNYINKEYPIPTGYYAVSYEIFLGKRLVNIYTANQPKIS